VLYVAAESRNPNDLERLRIEGLVSLAYRLTITLSITALRWRYTTDTQSLKRSQRGREHDGSGDPSAA